MTEANPIPLEPPTPPAGAPVAASASTAPIAPRKTNRTLLKYLGFGILTLGIYDIVVLTESANTVNIAAHDGKRTMHYCLLAFLVSPITLGIAGLVWYNNFSNRIGDELARRGLERTVSARDYWLWSVLWALIVSVPVSLLANLVAPGWFALDLLAIIGPCVYVNKLFTALNALAADYNAKG
jgi:hypothetical protein